MKRRWKGLCALWMVLALVVGTSPVTVAAEDEPGAAVTAESMVSQEEALDEGEELSREESSSEGESETDTPEGRDEGEEDTSESLTVEESGETSEENRESDEAVGDSDETQGDESEMTEEESSSQEELVKDETEESGSVEETSQAESAVEEMDAGTGGELESEAILLESVGLPTKAVAEGAEGTSGEAWLYIGSGEVDTNQYYVGSAGYNDVNSHREQIVIQFDTDFSKQINISGITPQDKKLNGWKLWGFNSSGFVISDLGELELNGQISSEDYQGFGLEPGGGLLVTVLWRNAQNILDGDTLDMNIGDSCILSDGEWIVHEQDSTIYKGSTEGKTVYAAKSGTFKFHKK